MGKPVRCELKVAGICSATWGECDHSKNHRPHDDMPDTGRPCTEPGQCPVWPSKAVQCIPVDGCVKKYEPRL